MRKLITMLSMLIFLSSILLLENEDVVKSMPARQINQRLVVIDYELKMKLNINLKSISASCKAVITRFNLLDSIEFHLAKDFAISKITDQNNKLLSFTRHGDIIQILAKDIHQSDTSFIIIYYEGFPQISKNPPWESGFVWKNNNDSSFFVGIVCELDGASIWWPTTGDWGEKPVETTFVLEYPQSLDMISNGLLTTIDTLANGNLEAKWRSIYPINTYNLTFYLAHFRKYEDSVLSNGRDLYIELYLNKSHSSVAITLLTQIKDILVVYEKYFGNYPFSKVPLKVVETPLGGMEHQTAITFQRWENPISSFRMLGYEIDLDEMILHEIAHEWWGNSVSAKNRSDLWINESMAYYSEALYIEEKLGLSRSRDYINDGLIPLLKNRMPLCDTVHEAEYGTDIYFKGCAFWNTVRSVTNNDSVFFAFLKCIQINYKYSSLSTWQLMGNANHYLQFDAGALFQQYIYSPDIPILEIKAVTNNPQKLLMRWTHCLPSFAMTLYTDNTRSDEGCKITTAYSTVILNQSLNVTVAEWQKKYLMGITYLIDK